MKLTEFLGGTIRNEHNMLDQAVRDLTPEQVHYVPPDTSANHIGFTLWHYKAGTITDLLSSNFFGDCSDMMARGDHIHVSAHNGAALLAVESADAGGVSVRKMVA